jgi:polyhydroxybutyrate depolymerase
MRRLLLVALSMALLGGCHAPAPSAPSVDQVPTGSSAQSVAGREFRVYRPATLPVTAPVPLVVMLHGGFGSASQAEQAYGWNDAADRYGFVVAYPDGVGRAWAVGDGCCGEPGRTGVDDVAFITAVVANLRDRLPLDPRRLFVTGMSNGAMMSYRLACSTDAFAAMAPVSGTLLGSCPDPRPLSVLHIHGLADQNVPFDGSPGNGPGQIDGPPVPSTVDIWRTADRCSPAAVTTAGAVTTSTAACPDGRAVVLITVAGAGHQWPGGVGRNLAQRAVGMDEPSAALDATDTIWRFFAAHPAPTMS